MKREARRCSLESKAKMGRKTRQRCRTSRPQEGLAHAVSVRGFGETPPLTSSALWLPHAFYRRRYRVVRKHHFRYTSNGRMFCG